MSKEKEIQKIKCKHCQTILTTEINLFQTCKCGKTSFDTDNSQFHTRIVGNQEDYEIIK